MFTGSDRGAGAGAVLWCFITVVVVLVIMHSLAWLGSDSGGGDDDAERFLGPCDSTWPSIFAHSVRLNHRLWWTFAPTSANSRYKQPQLVTKSDGQMEDGHAMMKLSTFHSFQTLGHAVRGCHKTVNKCARI